MIINKNDKLNLKKELANSLLIFSNGFLDNKKAFYIANQIIENIDLNNSALAHKGIHWLARDILKKIT